MIRSTFSAALVFSVFAAALAFFPTFSAAQTMTKREIRDQYRKARKAAKGGDYEKASRLYFDIIENGAVSPAYQRTSRYRLARSLFRQKLQLVSLRYVIRLLQDTKPDRIDASFLGSLSGLLRIARSLNDETLIVRMLGSVKALRRKIPKGADPIATLLPVPERYKKRPAVVKKWEARRKKLRNTLAYMLGRIYFLKRRKGFGIATRFLNLIKPSAVNNYHAKALYLKGVMAAWNAGSQRSAAAFQKKYNDAIANFRKIVKLEPVKPKDRAELETIKKYAQYGIARAYYAVGVAQASPKKKRKFLVDSLREYMKLRKISKIYQAQVLFETAYVHFWMEQYHFSLGKLLALQSPYYKTGFFPELQILRALIYFKTCKYEDTKQTVLRFEKQYQPLKKQLIELVGRRKKKKWLAQYYEYFLKEEAKLLKKQKTELPVSLVSSYRSNKGLRNYRALLARLEQELQTIRSKGATWKESNLGKALLESALNFRGTLKKFAGQNVWNSVRRSLQELSGLLSQAGLIQLETLQEQKKQLMRYAEGGGIEQDEYRYTIVTEHSHIYWPYQGEYWRDEVGNYRQFIQGECKR